MVTTRRRHPQTPTAFGHDSLGIVDKKPPWTRRRHPQSACVCFSQRVRVLRVAFLESVGRPALWRSEIDDSFTPWRPPRQDLTTVSHTGNLEARSRRQCSALEVRGAKLDDCFTAWRSGRQHVARVSHSADPGGERRQFHISSVWPSATLAQPRSSRRCRSGCKRCCGARAG